jgi:hypothetical protein
MNQETGEGRIMRARKDDISNKYLIKTMAGFALVLAFSVSFLFAAALEVPRVTNPPVIDGKLDDPVWDTALRMTEFKTFKPDFGKEPSQKTEGYVLCDSDNIYFAFRAYDSEPSKIKASISKRDGMFSDDFVGVFLDTFNTKQQAYAFVANPFGIQGDGILNAAGNLDSTFDMVWYSKGQIDARGYTVEIRVPLQSIRFPNKGEITMMTAFFRQIVRTSEMVSSPAIYPEKGAILAQTQPVIFRDLQYKRVVEILPAVTYSLHYNAQGGLMVRDMNEVKPSLTGKVGLTSDMTFDGTINPDFSQVESDAGQIDFNRRYALYYSEKRPFFLEGNEIFKFAGSNEDSYLQAVVHTRTIIDPTFGVKLNGKVGASNSVAAIYAQDDFRESDADPRPMFSILRFKHAFTDDSYLGAFYAARDQGSEYNRVAGADGVLRLSGVSTAEFHLFGSLSRPDGSSPQTQGYAAGLAYNYSTRAMNIQANYEDVSPNFQVDTGFLQRTGYRSLTYFVDYNFYPKSQFFQKVEPFYWGTQLYDTTYDMLETMNVLALRIGLPRSSQIRFDALLGNEVFEGHSFNRIAWRVQGFTQFTKQLYFQGYFRRGGMVYYDPDNPYQGYGDDVQLALEYQPTEKLDLMLTLAYMDFYRKSDNSKVYDYAILRSHNTFQINQYLFLRAIVEYNDFRKRLTLDTLISFTYIPGTVIFLGYGSALDQVRWDGTDYVESNRFRETQRGFFFKVSYLWRL